MWLISRHGPVMVVNDMSRAGGIAIRAPTIIICRDRVATAIHFRRSLNDLCDLCSI